MITAAASLPRDLSEFKATMTLAEARSHTWRRLLSAVDGELAAMRKQNDFPEKIEATTLLRGRIDLAKRILALSDEVGPESRASEALSHESQIAGAVAGIHLDLDDDHP